MNSKLVYERATVDHANAIKLRECDDREVALWDPSVPQKELLCLSVLHSSEAFTALKGGEVVAIGGYTATTSRVVPWLVGSDLLDQHRKELMRISKGVIEDLKLLANGRLISNHVARDNSKARLFLQSLGFVIAPSPGSGEFDFFFLPTCASQQQP